MTYHLIKYVIGKHYDMSICLYKYTFRSGNANDYLKI